MMSKKKRNESLAKSIRKWLLQNEMWFDTVIYFNDKAYSSDDGEKLVVHENEDPSDHFEYVNPDHILSMSFEGPLYAVMNGYCNGCIRLTNEFERILDRFGVYYELGNSWNLTCYEK